MKIDNQMIKDFAIDSEYEILIFLSYGKTICNFNLLDMKKNNWTSKELEIQINLSRFYLSTYFEKIYYDEKL
jgi:hypothetical protein